MSVDCWNQTAKVRDYMVSQGYPLTREGYYRLWDEFTSKELAMLEGLGRTALVWDDTLGAGINLSPSTIVQVWQTSKYHEVNSTLHPTPYTLHPTTPYTLLHPKPYYTLFPTPYTQHPTTPYHTLHPQLLNPLIPSTSTLNPNRCHVYPKT